MPRPDDEHVHDRDGVRMIVIENVENYHCHLHADLSPLREQLTRIEGKLDQQVADKAELVQLAADVKAHAAALKAAIPTT